MLFPHKCLWRPHERGPFTLHSHALKHSWRGVGKMQDCVLNSRGFIVQSDKIPLHVTNKWMRQTKGKERVGWKMSAAAVKLLLISHARAWRSSPPRRVTSEEQGWQWRGSFCFAAQLTQLSVSYWNPLHFSSRRWCKKQTLLTCVFCEPESGFFSPIVNTRGSFSERNLSKAFLVVIVRFIWENDEFLNK